MIDETRLQWTPTNFPVDSDSDDDQDSESRLDDDDKVGVMENNGLILKLVLLSLVSLIMLQYITLQGCDV